ncbi:hypothetical protein [Paenibacillus sp. IITD108]|uniref:hypothetical protein n=1 Tax=Paenibacillus sp. IITD108 TaxID=3116649 RepID=UPI002F42167F
MRFFLIIVSFSMLLFSGCSADKNKREIETTISIFQESLIQKDFNRVLTIIDNNNVELIKIFSEEALATEHSENFTAFKTIETVMSKNEAVVTMETDYEVKNNWSDDYDKLQLILTLHLQKKEGKWLIHKIEDELAPGSTRSPQK